MSNDHSAAQAVQAGGNTPMSTTKRRRPKTTEEQLAESMAKTEALMVKALDQRNRMGRKLIEDLYLRHGIGEIDGDVSEVKRLAVLHERLDL